MILLNSAVDRKPLARCGTCNKTAEQSRGVAFGLRFMCQPCVQKKLLTKLI